MEDPSARLPAMLSAGGILLHVKVAPKSRAEAFGEIESYGGKTYLKMQVTAAAEDGKANGAVCQAVARWLGVRKSAVAIHSGHKSRFKCLSISGGRDIFEKLTGLLQSRAGGNAGSFANE